MDYWILVLTSLSLTPTSPKAGVFLYLCTQIVKRKLRCANCVKRKSFIMNALPAMSSVKRVIDFLKDKEYIYPAKILNKFNFLWKIFLFLKKTIIFQENLVYSKFA